MTDMPDAAKMVALANEATEALKALHSLKAGNEETKRNVENVLTKYQDVADRVAAVTALQAKADADHKDRVAGLEQKLEEAKKGSAEYETRVKELELAFAKKGKGKDAEPDRTARTYLGFFDYITKGIAPENLRDIYSFRPELSEFKSLRTDSDIQGGYLIPQIMDNEIRKNITEISPVRMYARSRVSPGKTMDIPRRLALLQASFEGEAEVGEEGQSTYGSEQVTLYRQTVTVPATLDMMVSSAFDLEREISADVGESSGKSEGTQFMIGTGDKGPQGITANTRIEVMDTAASGEVDFSDIAELAGKLKRGQTPWWFFNRRTLAKLWQIKSSIGVPIWQPVAGNVPATIWGFPYDSNMIDLDDAQNGAGAKPIIFGDMRRGYEIFDMIGISVVRDDLTKKRQAITEWTFRRYLTGRVIIPEAFKILRVKA